MAEASTQSNKRRHKKRKNAAYFLEILLCLIAFTAIMIATAMIFKFHSVELDNEDIKSKLSVYEDPENPYIPLADANQKVSEASEEAYTQGQESVRNSLLGDIKNKLLETNSSLETLKSFYPDELILVDNSEYHFVPIDSSLGLHDFNVDNFKKNDNGRIEYSGEKTAVTGIDVSKFQEKINWTKVAGDDVDFAIIRVGYRGYSKGEIFDDERFTANIKGALENDIEVGVYFLTQATTEKEAIEEANYVLDQIEPYKITYPVVLDVEAVGGNEGRGNMLSMEERTKCAKAFLDTIQKAGYDVSIYGNLKTFILMLDLKELGDYSKWFAGYTDFPYYPYEFDMWQYTDTGKINGISENVDINIYFK